MGETYLDASLFLGMHSTDPATRAACKGFFVTHLHLPTVMTYEEVGRCDDVVWGRPRRIQDLYYPFMDVLHSVLDVRRRGYQVSDLTHLDAHPLTGLRPRERLLLSAVSATGGRLVTVNPRLLRASSAGLPVCSPRPSQETAPFPDELESLYRQSLALEVDHAEV